MPRTCTICNHERRSEIDAALLAGEPLRDIAGRWSVSKSAVARYAEHIPPHLAKAQEAHEVAQADNLLGSIKGSATKPPIRKNVVVSDDGSVGKPVKLSHCPAFTSNLDSSSGNKSKNASGTQRFDMV